MLINSINRQSELKSSINMTQSLDLSVDKIDLAFKNSYKLSQEELFVKLLLQKFKPITIEDLKQTPLIVFATIFKEFDAAKGHITEYKFMSVKKSP